MQQANNGPHDGIATDLFKGAVAGAVGVWVMDQIGDYMYTHEDYGAYLRERRAQVEGMDVAHVAANKAARAIADVELGQPHPAGIAVHYAIGIGAGALYGILRHRVPGPGLVKGLAYGLATTVVEDEITGPAMGWASRPTAYPWQAHARGLVEHLVLGVVIDAVCGLLDRTGGKPHVAEHVHGMPGQPR